MFEHISETGIDGMGLESLSLLRAPLCGAKKANAFTFERRSQIAVDIIAIKLLVQLGEMHRVQNQWIQLPIFIYSYSNAEGKSMTFSDNNLNYSSASLAWRKYFSLMQSHNSYSVGRL